LCVQAHVTLWGKPQRIPRCTQKGKEGVNPGMEGGQGDSERCRGLIQVQVAISVDPIPFPDISLLQGCMVQDPFLVSEGVQIHDVAAPD